MEESDCGVDVVALIVPTCEPRPEDTGRRIQISLRAPYLKRWQGKRSRWLLRLEGFDVEGEGGEDAELALMLLAAYSCAERGEREHPSRAHE